MVLYEELGFDAICINEHHAKPYGLMPSPNLIAAALTQRTRRIKIGILGNLPALHAHPVRLAEEIAMLDLHVGRPDHLGLRPRRAPGVPGAQRAAAESRERLDEAWELDRARRGRPTSRSTWQGKHFSTTACRSGRGRSSSRTRRSCSPRTATRGSSSPRAGGCRPASRIARRARTRAIFERYRAARGPARLDADGRGLPRAAPRLRGRDERARARGGGAAPRLLLAEAPELSPRLDEAARPGAAGAARPSSASRRTCRSTSSTST